MMPSVVETLGAEELNCLCASSPDVVYDDRSVRVNLSLAQEESVTDDETSERNRKRKSTFPESDYLDRQQKDCWLKFTGDT